MSGYRQLVSLNVQGVAIVFGRSLEDHDIYYNVLGQDVDVNDDNLDWSGFTRLEFTPQVRQVGMSIITLVSDSSTMTPSQEPFRVLTDQKYVSVIQQSAQGTLYLNRFRLLKTTKGTDRKTTSYVLTPAWEVRFARSHKGDIPADRSDTQEYLDPDGKPFLEPAYELSMVDAVQNGAFDVLLLPVSNSNGFNWQFLIWNKDDDTISLYNFPATPDGLFDLSAKTITDSYEIGPDSVFSITDETGGALPIQGPPRGVLYVKHENIVQPDGTSIGVKRAARAMIAIPVTHKNTTVMATIDSALAPDGKLATLSGPIAASTIVPAEFDLAFDGCGYLELKPPASGNNPLAITGAYSMSLMIRPQTLGDGIAIIGGQNNNDPKTLAPYIKIVDGDKIEIGFGNGTAAVSCRTQQGVLKPGIWTSLEVVYSGPGDNPFTLKANGCGIPLSACTTDSEPAGTAIALIGNRNNGFRGALNSIAISVGKTAILTLPCNDVDYGSTPPTTPNIASSGVIAEVHGPKEQPSTSPVNRNMSGTFHIDPAGLTYYAAIADFIQPYSPACLTDGSDGLLHLYYQGAGSKLSVCQFSKNSARATFYTAWNTRTDKPAEGQSGFINFIAHRVGTYMNAAEITVKSSPVSALLCDVSIRMADGAGEETWSGLPRNIEAFVQVWNGAAVRNADDQDVISHKKPYFDYDGNIPAVLVPGSDTESGNYFLFTSVPSLAPDIASVEVQAGQAAGFVNITIESTPPPGWDSHTPLVQVWPDVPAAPQAVSNVLSGRSPDYDYGKVTTPQTRAYGLMATTTRSDEQTSRISIFVRDALASFSVSITSSTESDKCNVTIGDFHLPGVPRDQNAFVRVINGEDGSYQYPEHYKENIAANIYGITNGLTASVLNFSGTIATAGVLPYAGLLRIVYSGQPTDTEYMAPIAKTAAQKIQGAKLTFSDREHAIYGSRMFGAVIATRPTDGGTGKIMNTAAYTDGKAPVLAPGVNGGWMPQPPRFGLFLNESDKDNYVRFNIDREFSPSDKLAISSDMTLTAWVNPAQPPSGQVSRILTFNVTGNRQEPDLPLQYMIGTRQGAGLRLTKSTFVNSSYNFSPPDMTVQIYVKPDDTNNSGTLLSVSEVRGSTVFLVLSINKDAKPEVDFMGGAGTLTGESVLPAGKWSCLTVTVEETDSEKVQIGLYVNDSAPRQEVFANPFKGMLGALVVGSQNNNALPATINGMAFWQRALATEEVRNSYLYGFADNDNMLGIRWNFAEGTGSTAVNTAATGPEYNGEITNPADPAWDPQGAFQVPYAGRNDFVLTSGHIVKGWTNIALLSRQGRALALDGANYGYIEDGSPFNPGSSFAIEAWIKPKTSNCKQVIAEKPGSYSLYIDTLGRICLTVNVSRDGDTYYDPPVHFTYDIKTPLDMGKTSYVVVNFTTGTVQDESGSKEYVPQKYYIKTAVYINGSRAATSDKDDYPKAVTVDNEKSGFYVGVGQNRTFYFNGLISHLRVWGRTLKSSEIARVSEYHDLPVNQEGLIAGWNFDEQSGTLAKDTAGSIDLKLSSNRLWSVWQDVASASLLINGRESTPLRLQAEDVGGYGDSQFTLGGMMQSSNLTLPFRGQIDDIRLYSTLLTGQQVRESMNKALTGIEDDLAGYWKIDAGSGDYIFDMTGRGNNGSLLPADAPPRWVVSTAPIQNEGEVVENVLDDLDSHLVALIDGEPAVIEYPDAEKNAYGTVFSVMKRGYFYTTSQMQTVLRTGYKVGDLDTIFVGQVQSKPSIVGYIEGGPPLPSENQTLAYWSGDNGGPARLYAKTSTVTYAESETKTWSFSGNQSSTFNGNFNLKGGFYLKTKSEVSVGLGAETSTQTLESKHKLGLKTTLSGDYGAGQSISQSHSNTQSLTSTLSPPGTWEPSDNILNPVVGRRYIQNNIGLAIVKSATADLFMMALKGTQTPVGYTMVPNKNIPVDTNLIEFPINPKYIKNGTLDGKVGLVNDPDYPNANLERGSYFKPVEAYNLKLRIEKEEQQIKAYYDQFDENKYKTINSLDKIKDKLEENPAFDFSTRINQRSIYNNYVWSAGGGLYKEEHTIANSYSEAYSGKSSLKFAMGLEYLGDIGTPFGGYYIETDVLLGNTWEMTASKNETTTNGFQLNCTVDPTSFLNPPILSEDGDGKLKFNGYADTPAPGKVDSYRYMAFLLAPSEENFTQLSTVIDQNWLNNSTTAAANAMREAILAETRPWRILYRTTFVSRVPAPFQPVKDDANAPNIIPPVNQLSNCWLIQIISKLIPGKHPTALEIGSAIDQVLGHGGEGGGILEALIPWWRTFYSSAQTFGTEEFRELAELREDLLQYMIRKYQSDQYLEK